MTRIQSMRRLASLRPSALSVAPVSRTSFVANRPISSTQGLREETHQPDVEAISAASRTRRQSRLRLPPKKTQEAVSEEDAANDPTYTPAQSIEDLEAIPSLDTWWKQPGNWGPESEFHGFGAAEKVADVKVTQVLLRRALVEALALQQQPGAFEQWAFKTWPVGDKQSLDLSLQAEIEKQGERIALKGDGTPIVETLTRPVEQEQTSQPSFGITSEEAAKAVKSWDKAWKNAVLTDELKFLVRKRMFQLTGTLLPDAKLGAIRTPRDFLALYTVKPKAKKLHLHIRESHEFKSLPNVKIHGRRITPIDKEKAVGRWKVIEEELKMRDLPVTGKGDKARHSERIWLTGKR